MVFDLRKELPFEDVLPFIREDITRTVKWSKDRIPNKHTVKSDIIKPAVKKMLAHMSMNGEIHPIKGAEGHDIPFLEAWNSLAEGTLGVGGITNYYLDEVLHGTMGIFDLMFMGIPREKLGNVSEEEAYEVLIEAIQAGDFETSDQDCRVDGIRYKFKSEGWSPAGYTPVPETGWPYEKGPQKWKRIEPIGFDEAHGIEHLEVEFESGELLVSCIIGIEEFDKLADPIRREFDTSFAGQIEQTRKSWEELGLIDIPVGKTSPYVIQEDGLVKVAAVGLDLSEEARENKREELDKHWSFLTQRWCVSVIDKQRLLSHLVEAIGDPSEARKKVAEFEAKYETGTIKVEPGVHHLYFGRDTDNVLNEHEFEGVDTEDLDTFFILSRDELSYKPKTPADEDPSSGMKM